MEALLVIDVQCGMFANPAFPPHEGEAVVSRIAGLLRTARAVGTPVVFVQHDGGVGDPLDRNSPGFAFRPEIAPLPGKPVVVKHFCSAFQETELAGLLAARGIDALTLCGMQTEFCVDTTVRTAFGHGLKVILVSDAHTSMDSATISAGTIIAHHNATLRDGGFTTLRKAKEIRFG